MSEELGVRYVLEGSVRRADDRVRITAQLIDAVSGIHLWAERYDISFQDMFFLQDEITINIHEAMQIKLTYGEIARELSHGTKNLNAYLKVLEAWFYMFKGTPESYIQAKKLLDEAIILDPEYAQPYVF